MNTVEDHVYADFCARIGVANIRQYEERELVLQQERAKIKADFDQQIDRVTTRLDFEKTKDTQGKSIPFDFVFQFFDSNLFCSECATLGTFRSGRRRFSATL